MKTSRVLPLVLCLLSGALALPGQSTTLVAAGISASRLKDDEVKKLVFIKAAQIKDVTEFTSQSGRKHLKFNFVSGSQYPAIVFEGDWNAAEAAQLKQGKADLYGVWGTFLSTRHFFVGLEKSAASDDN